MDVVTKYVEAERKFTALDQRLDAVSDFMLSAGEVSGEYRHVVSLANCSTARLPPEVVSNPRHVTINASEWPSPDQVGALLSEWHKARDEMRGAWFAMPNEIRNKMKIHDALAI